MSSTMSSIRIPNVASKRLHSSLKSSSNHSSLDSLSPTLNGRFAGGRDNSNNDDANSADGDLENETYATQPPSSKAIKRRKIIRHIKRIFFGICWLTFTVALMLYDEHGYEPTLLTIPATNELKFRISKDLMGTNLLLQLKGPFTQKFFEKLPPDNKPFMTFGVQQLNKKTNVLTDISEQFSLGISPNVADAHMEYVIRNLSYDTDSNEYELNFISHNMDEPISAELFLTHLPETKFPFLLWGSILLVIIYINIVFHLVHPTLAGAIGCSLALSILAVVNLRLPLRDTFATIEMNVVMNFFGVSIIIELLSETGVQDYLAAVFYEVANGHIWPVLNIVFLVSWSLSTVFDKVTLLLFFAPICLRLCEIMHLSCVPILSCLIIALNVGSALTPSSSQINDLIVNYPSIGHNKISYWSFALHMLPVTILALAQSYLHLRLLFRKSTVLSNLEPLQIERLKRLTRVWRKVSDRMGGYSLDERSARDTVDNRVRTLRNRLKSMGQLPKTEKNYEQKVQKIRDLFPIKKYPIVIACFSSLAVIPIFTTLNLVSDSISVAMGWRAIIAALLALSICNFDDIDGILGRIDWAAMLLVSCLFIFMQALIELGFLSTLENFLDSLLANTEEKHRLTVAILCIVWISAGLSTLMYNFPVARLMTPIVVAISMNENLNLPYEPLVFALSLGCVLGGNGSIMASIASITCAGVTSQHGYSITYLGYMKIGFCVMVGNIIVASCYLLAAHVYGHWH